MLSKQALQSSQKGAKGESWVWCDASQAATNAAHVASMIDLVGQPGMHADVLCPYSMHMQWLYAARWVTQAEEHH